MLFVFRGAQLLQQQSHSILLVLYEPSLPAKAAQAWWNGHALWLDATAYVEHTQPLQLQVDDC